MEITTTNTGLVVQQNNHPMLKPWAKNVPKPELFQVVTAAIAKCYADLNFKEISDFDKNYLVNEVTDNILKYYPSMRLEEIQVAFANGIRQHYGEFMGLSVITFEKFISGYMLSKERADLVKSTPVLLEEKKEPDNLTKFKLAKENTVRAFQLKKEGKDIDLYSLPVYEFLDGLKLIQFSIEDKYDFIENAKVKLKDELESRKLSETDPIRGRKITNSIKAIIEGKDRESVIVKAKKLALHAYFESIILEDNNLSQLIEDNKEAYLKGIENG